MKKAVLISAVILLTSSLSFGQWLETTIWLPDSMVGLYDPVCLAYNPTNDRVYVGGRVGVGLFVIDGASSQKIAKLRTKAGVRALCYNQVHNKLYVAAQADSIAVVDGTSSSVVAMVPVGRVPWLICCNSQGSKAYCANRLSNDVSVIDCSADTVVATISLGTGSYPAGMCHNCQDDKVYCSDRNDGSVFVIDGSTDTLITRLFVDSCGWMEVSGCM